MRPNYSSFVFLGFRIYYGIVSNQGRSSARRSVFLSSASIFDTLLKRPTIFCPIFSSIFHQKPLYLVVKPFYFPFNPQFCIIITDSTCPTQGNISTIQHSSARYPSFFNTPKSLPKLTGLQEIYTIFPGPSKAALRRNSSELPFLGGSMSSTSAFAPSSAICVKNRPASAL